MAYDPFFRALEKTIEALDLWAENPKDQKRVDRLLALQTRLKLHRNRPSEEDSGFPDEAPTAQRKL